MPPRYADLEIRIRKQDAAGYSVVLTLGVDGEQELGRGVLTTKILPWLPTADPGADGQRLFNLLFASDNLKQAWAWACGQAPQRRIRLHIEQDAPELHAIPWELLRDANDGQPVDLASNDATPFSRFQAGKWPHRQPIRQRTIKVLIAIANPTGLDAYGLRPIDADQELAVLEAAAQGTDVALTPLPAPCTLAALEAELNNGYHVLHLVAHGAVAQGQTVLFLADQDNQVQPVHDSELRDMLARQSGDASDGSDDRPRLVFLASCDSAKRDTANAFRGLAPMLVAAGVPAVLAMQDRVPILTARAFTATFYRRLLYHGLVDLAANEARSYLLSDRQFGASIPVLFMRLKDGRLIESGERDSGKTPWTVLFRRNKTFGREKDLKAIHDRLTGDGDSLLAARPVGLTGLGGIGKTQLAVEYCYRYQRSYPGGVFWIDASAPLLAGFAAQCVAIKPDLSDGKETEQAAAVANHLCRHSDALLVLDNVSDPASLTLPVLPGVIPADLPCRMLFTTRPHGLSQFTTLEVAELPEDAALDLLLRADSRQPILEASHREHAEARTICRTLGNLPLALELAAAFLGKQPQVNLADYRRELERRSPLLVVDDPRAKVRDLDLPTRHRAAVAATFTEQVDTLSSADAKLVLRVAGQLPEPAHLATAWLGALSGLRDQDDGIFDSPLTLALDRLDESSLVKRLEPGAVNFHPLVHEFAALLTPQDQRQGFREELVDNAVESLAYPERPQDWPVTIGQCLLAFGRSELPQEKRILVLEALRKVMVTSEEEGLARRAAFLLTRLDWLAILPRISVADMLLYEDLIGRYVASSSEGQYLVDHLTRMLSQRDLDAMQRTQLLARRGAMLGQMNNLKGAERDYGEAARLVQDLPVDRQLAARIYLGGANIARNRAEDPEVPEGERQQSKEQAEDLYGLLARTLETGKWNLELKPEFRISCHLQLLRWFVLQNSWQEAEVHYLMARRALEDVSDPEANETQLEWIAESYSEMYWRKGNWHDSQGEPTEALDAYERAYETARIAVERLRVIGPEGSENLAYALCNSGQYLLALSAFAACSVADAASKACENWREALEIAVRLNLKDVEVETRANISNHCSLTK